jgi:pyruvate dehydrogenase E2 component (dihydrolipoamide acetyltransferase)
MEVVAYIGEKDEPLPKGSGSKGCAEAAEVAYEPAADEEPETTEEKSSASEVERIKISPVAKKMAADAGIDISEIAGSGPDGRILKEDIEKAINVPKGRRQDQNKPVCKKDSKRTGHRLYKDEDSGKRP